MKDAAQGENARRTRKSYKTPEVVVYGSVAELTAGGQGSVGDVGGMPGGITCVGLV